MRYQEGQVDYYVKKGMSLLGIVEIRQKFDEGVSGVEYLFVEYVIKIYSGQYHVQVGAVMQLDIYIMQYCHPSPQNAIIQSDNTISFASQELIPFIFNMNTRLDDEKNVVFSRWIFTGAQTRKTLFVYSLLLSK